MLDFSLILYFICCERVTILNEIKRIPNWCVTLSARYSSFSFYWEEGNKCMIGTHVELGKLLLFSVQAPTLTNISLDIVIFRRCQRKNTKQTRLAGASKN